MNFKRKYLIVAACILAAGTIQAQSVADQDSTGLPGDNFSLEGALEMFKKAGSPEEFERLINSEDNKVNNLDLNGDGEIDYIRVIDQRDGDAHAFVLQAVVSETENQDVAVIELEKKGNDDAVLQIVGDEDIYGEQVIVEPAPEKPQAQNVKTTVVVNVWAWPAVRYVYAPAYAVWISPWGWRVRPVWYHPWRPVRWHVFYPYRAPYRHHYVVVHTHRVVHAHRVYTPHRTTSVTVRTRNQASVTHYRTTRTTTRTATTPRGREVKATRKTTTVQGKRGKATRSTTVVKKRKR